MRIKQTAIENFESAAKNIRYSSPTKRSTASGNAAKKKKRIKDYFLPRKESALHHATNIVGISTKIPQYNYDMSSILLSWPSILFL